MERLFDPVMWGWCWLSWLIVADVLPGPHTYQDWRQRIVDRAELWLLPFAGFYAYHDPECGTTWRWSERVRHLNHKDDR